MRSITRFRASGTPPSARTVAGLVTVAATAAAVRLPFLGTGWGSDMDAWRYAGAALHMHESGRYEPSRIPAFPAYELMLAVLQPGGPVAAVLWSAICGVVAAVLFVRVAQRLGLPHPLLLGMALALAPGAAVTATQAMDYAQAMALLVAAWLALLNGWGGLGGVLLGAAAATRPTLALVAPAAMALLALAGRDRTTLVRAGAGLVGSWLAFHLPTFGHAALAAEANPLAFHAARQHVTWATFLPVVRGALVAVLGRLPLIVIVAGLAARALPARRESRSFDPRGAHWRPSLEGPVFEVLALAPLLVVYLLVPLDPGYLVVALPLALAMLSRVIRPSALVWLALACAVELAVHPMPRERRLGPGLIATERAERVRLLRETRRARGALPDSTIALSDRSLILRLLVHERSLERTPLAYAPFHAEGVALWTPGRRSGWANDLSLAQRDTLAAQGYRVMDQRTVRAGL